MRVMKDFDAFYATTSRRVLLHVYGICGDLGAAQDITQEAYARAWQRWAKVADYDNPEAWVRSVAWRLAANRRRGLQRWFAARSRLGRGPTAPGPNPDRVAVTAALQRIPAAQRRAVVMHYVLDLSVAQIALETGTPVGTVKVHLARARAALAPLLEESCLR
jgi:RNA polymerase sigma-70 factor (ECF subfamily)